MGSSWAGVLTASLAVALALSGCRTSSLSRLPKCEARAAAQPPAEWRRVEQHGFSFFLPSSCSPDPETPDFIHGGSRWRCGSVGVDLVWGMWGTGSWYRTGHIHEPIVSAWSSLAADVPQLQAITESGVLAGERGPNR